MCARTQWMIVSLHTWDKEWDEEGRIIFVIPSTIQNKGDIKCMELLQHTTATHCYNTLLQHTAATH